MIIALFSLFVGIGVGLTLGFFNTKSKIDLKVREITSEMSSSKDAVDDAITHISYLYSRGWSIDKILSRGERIEYKEMHGLDRLIFVPNNSKKGEACDYSTAKEREAVLGKLIRLKLDKLPDEDVKLILEDETQSGYLE